MKDRWDQICVQQAKQREPRFEIKVNIFEYAFGFHFGISYLTWKVVACSTNQLPICETLRCFCRKMQIVEM